MNWDQVLNENLAAAIAAIAICSMFAVIAWVSAVQKEREAFYKSEAIKKLAEMQGTPSEPVLQILREAVASWKQAPSHPAQAKAYYRAETMKRIAEMQGTGADSLVAFLREEERIGARRQREGIKLGGLITAGVGIGLTVFLRQVVLVQPVYLVGLVPLLVGAALLAYGYLFAPQD